MLSYGLGSRQVHAGMTNLDDFLKPHFSKKPNEAVEKAFCAKSRGTGSAADNAAGPVPSFFAAFRLF